MTTGRLLDRTLVVEPVKVRMLDGVRGVSFRFLTSNRQWVDRWPAQQVGSSTTSAAGQLRSK